MNKRQQTKILAVLIAGLLGVYGFSDMKLVFYEVIKQALNISDQGIGMVWSAFGIVAMLSYIGGGYLADKMAPSRMIAVSLLCSAALHLLMSLTTSASCTGLPVLMILSAAMGFCAVFLFFSASSKLITQVFSDRAGMAFGIYYRVAGIIGAVIALIASSMYIRINDPHSFFSGLLRVYAVIDILAGTFVFLIFRGSDDLQNSDPGIKLSCIPGLLKDRKMWIISVAVFCNYTVFSLMNYFTPYLVYRFHTSVEASQLISSTRIAALCLLSGLIWGKWTQVHGSVKGVIRASFVILAVLFGILVMIEGFRIDGAAVLILAVAVTCAITLVTLGVKSIALAMVSQEQIPKSMIGTMIGMVSFFGFSPVAAFYPVAGHVMSVANDSAFLILFVIGLLFSICGILDTYMK